MLITEQIVNKVLKAIEPGIVKGLGNPIPGQMCVEAAVCFALNLSHSDQPITCVLPGLIQLKIRLNDSNISSNIKRRDILKRLAIAQLGSQGAVNEIEFITELAKFTQEFVTKTTAARYAAADAAARYAAADATDAARYADAAARYAHAAGYVDAAARYAADAAAKYAAITAAITAADAAYDKVIADFCEGVVQILVKLKSPGTQFLYLTE